MRHFARKFLAALVASLPIALTTLCSAAQPIAPIDVQEIVPGVFVHQAPYALAAPGNRGAVGNFGFVIGSDAVAVIDTGGSFLVGQSLKAAIRARTDLPIRWVINTHFHPDHVLGNAAFRAAGVTFVGHSTLKRALEERTQVYLEANRRLLGDEAFAGTEVVTPDVGVADLLEIDLGGRKLQLQAFPTSHTNADLTAFDLSSGTWFVGDLVFVRHLPTVDGSLNGWIKTMESLEKHGSARIIPGHGPASLGLAEALTPQRRYLLRLREDIRQMIRDGKGLAEAAAKAGLSERDTWELFGDFNARNATAAYHELEWE